MQQPSTQSPLESSPASRAARTRSALQPKRSRPPRYRRRAPELRPQREQVQAAAVLRRYWDEHAVKTGIVMFWVWFAAANWAALMRLPGGVLN